MSLTFPDLIRIFDPDNSCIAFWGTDASSVVAFEIEVQALQKFGATIVDGNESESLALFDNNRSAILEAAISAHARRRAVSHRLSSADF